ncbi:MAG: hypothetical protein IPG06_20625 [Haliea sp.]|nr:hypothetical protein [Haliea sp.]
MTLRPFRSQSRTTFIQKAASKAGQSDSANDDVVLQLLLNASELSLAGAVPLGDQGWSS